MLAPTRQVPCQADSWSPLYVAAHVNALTTRPVLKQYEVAALSPGYADHTCSARTRNFKGVLSAGGVRLLTVVLVK
jgi:hypothetical protein